MNSSVKTLKITFVALTIGTIALAVAYTLALFYLYSFDRDPKLWTNLISFYARPSQASVSQKIQDEPSVLESLVVRGTSRNPTYASRYELSLSDIKSSTLHDCLLAAEDKRFYRHAGLDYLGLSSALLTHFIGGRQLHGASTITNQLMGEVILADRSRKGLPGFWRKFEEIILTSAAERHFSKDDLLLAYMNNVPVGHIDGRALIGLSAASEALFGKRKLKGLDLSEACVLVGMLHKPNYYLPDALKGDYRKIRQRREVILERLTNAFPDRYPRALIEKVKKEEIRFLKVRKPDFESHRLINYAYQQLPSRKPGLRVYITVDQALQKSAENAVHEKLAEFDRGPYGFYNQLSYRHALKEGRTAREEQSKLQAALVAVDPKTGEIVAMVGGRNSAGEYNRATQAKRAPASAIKPFVYLYGIKSGYLNGAPFRADTIIDPNRSPAAERYYTTAGIARARVQLARSDNRAAVALGHEFGPARVKEFLAKVLGIDPVATEILAIGAGKGSEVTPLQLASAYTIFANNGMRVSPKALWAAYDNETRLNIPEEKTVRVIDAGPPFVVTRMLQSVIGDGPDGQYGRAKMARQLSGLEASVALAGKTGTSNSDLWFVGFTPRLVVVVWVGFDSNYPRLEMDKGFSGSGLPLQIWARFMRSVKRYRPDLLKGSFEMPSNVRELTIDPNAGCISQIGIKEYYLASRLPPVCY
jgi:membrane peptidoglycan carboxypeptidase